MNIREFFSRCARIMNVFSRPKKKEFIKMATVTGLGIIVIGLIGLIISVVFHII
ncbi:MAG: protein translocase SEC61 complex subunit gamma [Candidatus Anstonellales archaeon]